MLPRLILIVLFSLCSVFAHAEQNEQEINPSKTELAINSINSDIADLSRSLTSASGDDRDAIQLQLFHKNEELRAKLALAVQSGDLPEAFLLTQIQKQKKYTQGATCLLYTSDAADE